MALTPAQAAEVWELFKDSPLFANGPTSNFRYLICWMPSRSTLAKRFSHLATRLFTCSWLGGVAYARPLWTMDGSGFSRTLGLGSI